jgi:wyosine [tRNA(Phe)-imidazoG37] synthetase (radical SAM superfamily)
MNPPEAVDSAESGRSVFQQHSRLFEDNRFVYPVVSRRSQGVSVGVNLNPDKVCNFDCIYCQVNRRTESETRFVEMQQLLTELESVLQLVSSGELFRHPKFVSTPDHLRRLNDIAFSGDGEPTTFRNFDEIIERAAEIKRQQISDDVRMVLITNASMFHREHVKRGLELLDQNNGQIWAKLDAGTEDYYKLIERTTIPFRRILENITAAATVRPLVIQSLFMNVNGVPPDDAEILAFCERLQEVTTAGGTLELIQIYTVARQPAESFVTALTQVEVERIASTVNNVTGLKAVAYV